MCVRVEHRATSNALRTQPASHLVEGGCIFICVSVGAEKERRGVINFGHYLVVHTVLGRPGKYSVDVHVGNVRLYLITRDIRCTAEKSVR